LPLTISNLNFMASVIVVSLRNNRLALYSLKQLQHSLTASIISINQSPK
jgi:hypothetical protein